MASYSCVQSIHKTLAASAADDVTLTGSWSNVEVLNRAGTAPVYFTTDGSVVNNEGPETFVVPAGSAYKVPTSDAAGSEVVKIVGNGNAYSVTGSND